MQLIIPTQHMQLQTTGIWCEYILCFILGDIKEIKQINTNLIKKQMLKDKIKTNGITDKVKHHTPSFAACQEFLFVLQTTEWSVGTQCDIMICKNFNKLEDVVTFP